MRVWICLFVLLSSLYSKDLRFLFVDVEGGQATFIVTPNGESILIDAGWPGNDARDAKRIQAAMKRLDLKRIDYFINSHYHLDHVGGIADLAQRVSITTFVDKGPNTEKGAQAERLSRIWEEAAAKGKRLTVKPGDKLPVKGVDILVVAADGNTISGTGPANPACAQFGEKDPDPTENARSIGLLLTYNQFRFLNLSDLTWNKERELVCPANKLGQIDLFLASHHGFDSSNFPGLLQAIQPRVSVVNNGARKGGIRSVIEQLQKAPRSQAVWQLHFAVAGAKDGNTTDPFIANVYEADNGDFLEATVTKDGKFTLFNGRNKFRANY